MFYLLIKISPLPGYMAYISRFAITKFWSHLAFCSLALKGHVYKLLRLYFHSCPTRTTTTTTHFITKDYLITILKTGGRILFFRPVRGGTFLVPVGETSTSRWRHSASENWLSPRYSSHKLLSNMTIFFRAISSGVLLIARGSFWSDDEFFRAISSGVLLSARASF